MALIDGSYPAEPYPSPEALQLQDREVAAEIFWLLKARGELPAPGNNTPYVPGQFRNAYLSYSFLQGERLLSDNPRQLVLPEQSIGRYRHRASVFDVARRAIQSTDSRHAA